MHPSPLLYRQSFVVRSFDVDFQRNLRMDVLCSFFQEAASEHALKLGVGYQQLEEQQMFWVLSRLLLQVERMPAWHEDVVVETWAKGTEKLFALRDFVVRDAQDEVIARATSYWLILHAQTRRPVRPEPFFKELKLAQHAISQAAGKLEVAEKMPLAYHIPIHYTDLDHNLHVNNIRYVSWMINCFPVQHYAQYRIRSLQINFLSEVRDATSVSIHQQELSPTAYLISGFRKGDEQPCFHGRVHWEQK